MTWFLIYLLVKMNDISTLFVLIATFSFIYVALCYVLSFLAHLEPRCSDVEAARQKVERANKRYIPIAVIAVIISILLPSRNDLLIIIGGTKFIEATQSDVVKDFGRKTLEKMGAYINQGQK